MIQRLKNESLSIKIAFSVLFIAVLALLYPTVSDFWNSFHESRVVQSYQKTVRKLDNAAYQAELDRARSFNRGVIAQKPREDLTGEEKSAYESLLNVANNGVMGYIEIPLLQLSLPIYHGLDDAVLQRSVGHLVGSSLPVGGEGTHSVIGAHRGLPSAKLFTELDRMQVGDLFFLHIMDETLTYKVDKISIITPDQWAPLAPVPEKDFCTLLTCTPYGINTHRLLVRGERIDNPVNSRVVADALILESEKVALFLAIPVLCILFVLVLRPRKKTQHPSIRRMRFLVKKKAFLGQEHQASDRKQKEGK